MKGKDFSHHNTLEQFNKVINTQDFMIFRAGYGKNHLDRKYKIFTEQCINNRKPYGAYWFSYAHDVYTARKEADYCIDIIDEQAHRIGCQPLYPIYYDFEYDSRNNMEKLGISFTSNLFNNMCEAFCQRIEERGYYAGIYVNYDYWKRLSEKLKTRYTIWFANWSGKDYGLSKYPIHMVQTGVIDKMDCDICNVNFPEIIQKKHLNGW